MNYKVTLRKDDQEETVIVSQAELLSDIYILRMFDPYQCPEGMEDDIIFTSKHLAAMIPHDKDIEITKVVPTEKEVPIPSTAF